jgi:hypothetical protein
MSWQSSVKHPLGLAGYALTLVFGLVARFGPTDQHPWLMPVAVSMAGVSLIGALIIASRHRSASHSETTPSETKVVQETQGDQAPAIAHVQGNVSLSYGSEPRKGQATE